MERVQSLIRAAVGAALLVAAPGCVTPPKTDGATKAPTGSPDPQAVTAAAAVPKTDGQVKPASATLPSLPSLQMPSVAKLTGKDKPGLPASLVVVAWRKKIEYLPDPTRNNVLSPGLVGEMFLVAANAQFTTPDGPVTVELYDETPRPGKDPAKPVRLALWRFEKDVVRQLATTDERFGKCYALFLPWPDYRPDIVKIRLSLKYEPEHGIPLFAEPFTTIIDNGTTPGQPGVFPAGFGAGSPLAGPPSPFGGAPPANLGAFGSNMPRP
jgi:hypothetical protein